MKTYYIGADLVKNGHYRPNEISSDINDFMDSEYVDALNKEWQVWEYPSGKIYDVQPNKIIPENSSAYYSHPGDGGWEVTLILRDTDPEKVAAAFATLTKNNRNFTKNSDE